MLLNFHVVWKLLLNLNEEKIRNMYVERTNFLEETATR